MFKKIQQIWYRWKAPAEWNTPMEDMFEKRKIKVGKNEDENIQLFIKNGCRFQNLIKCFQNSNMQFLF